MAVVNPFDANPSGTAQGVASVNQQVNNPGLPAGTQITPVLQNPTEIQDPYGTTLNGNIANPGAATGGPAAVTQTPEQIAAAQYAATQVAGQTPQATAAQGTMDPNALAQAAQADVDPRATVKGQLTDLLKDPDQTWAAGATRAANDTMASRGMGSSTMAGDAITRAAIESALPIAGADAQTYAQYGLANLNNRQATALQNAKGYADLNIANLNNEQAATLANLQARLTTLLSDQSAENAAKNFNATSQNQTEQFMASLSQSAAQYNVGQVNAMAQFSAGQTNSWNEFQQNLVNQREQFNSTQADAIEAANFQYRRQTNTANTAAINAANATNAQNRLNLSNYAMDKIWTEFRDEANFSFQSSENEKTRAGNIAMAAFQNANYKDLLNDQQKAQMANILGQVGVAFLANLG